MDIFIIKNSFQTLVDIIIADLTHLDLVQHVLTTIVHATIVVVQDKTWFYTERTLGDDFIPLAIETYSCLHPHFDSFLTICVHAYVARHQ